jgi:hypothetical protein
MTLTTQQLAHFETFGFVVLRQLFDPGEMAGIIREFHARLDEDLDGREFTGEIRLAVSSFIENSPDLWWLPEDDRIQEPVAQILGSDFLWRGSGANLYVGNTEWHRDAADLEVGFTRLNVIFYLDPVGNHSGCMRFIPGSHREPFNSAMRPINIWRKKQVAKEGRIPQSDVDEFAAEFNITEDEPLFGVLPDEIPCHGAETEPGDVVLFNMHTYHATYGGRTGRRMFAMNFASNPVTEAQIALIRRLTDIMRKGREVMQHNANDTLYPEEFLNSDRPRIQRMVSRLVELGLK